MTVYFFNQTLDKKCVDKNLDTENNYSLSHLNGYKHKVTATFKSDSSIENPLLEVAYDSDLVDCNYFYIEEWHRWYFIDNITVSAQRMIISGHVDVLYTNKSAIYNMKAVIARSAKNGNLWQNDKFFRVNQFNNNEQIDFPYTPFSNFAHSYVLIVAGAVPAGGE